MKIYKSGTAETGGCLPAEELDAINAFAKGKLTAQEVYTFSVLLCDNEVDRDNERFSMMYWLNKHIPELALIQSPEITVCIYVGIIIIGIILASISTATALRKYLNAHIDKLYA